MRYLVKKEHSTKAERRVYEVLKELKIPFKHRWRIKELEVDFLIGKVALDIDGHKQDGKRNHILAEAGYIPIHLTNKEVKDNKKLRRIIQKWQSQIIQRVSQVLESR